MIDKNEFKKDLMIRSSEEADKMMESLHNGNYGYADYHRGRLDAYMELMKKIDECLYE